MQQIAAYTAASDFISQPIVAGHVSRYDGHLVECDGFPTTIGSLCHVETQEREPVTAEIIGYRDNKNLLLVHEHDAQISVGARVVVVDQGYLIDVGPELLGRAIDALGNVLDDGPPMKPSDSWPLGGKKINPLARCPVKRNLDVGVRVINSLLTVGQGQRLGIISGSGVGKSVLLGMMTRFTAIARRGEKREAPATANLAFAARDRR